MVRRNDRDPHLASITPHAVHEFQTPEIEWLIQRQMLLHRIDVMQLEYTALGQYARRFDRWSARCSSTTFTSSRSAERCRLSAARSTRLKARFEYLRAIRFELSLLPRCDQIQVCTLENKRYLESFLPGLAPRIDAGMRAGVDVSLYAYPGGPRRPRTMLFLGSFRHTPNQVALDWFTREVLPLVLRKTAGCAAAGRRLRSAAAPRFPRSRRMRSTCSASSTISSRYFPLRRVHLPDPQRLRRSRQTARSVRQRNPGGFDHARRRRARRAGMANSAPWPTMPRAFADSVIRLLEDPVYAAAMAARARQEVETNWDMAVVTSRLVEKYRALIAAKRAYAAKKTKHSRLTIEIEVK